MTEEVASPPAEEQENTPDPSGESGSPEPEGTPAEPTEGSEASDVDYEERYNHLQPEYTRATQEAAQYRQIIELARQGNPEALEYLGYEAPEDPDTEPEDEGELTPEQRIEKLEAERAEEREAAERSQEEEETQEAWQNFYQSEFKKLDPDEKLSETDKALIVGAAHQLPPAEDGLPDLEAGQKAIDDQFETRFKERVKSKRTPQAPSGASPSHQPDMDDREQRRAWMAERYAETEEPSL